MKKAALYVVSLLGFFVILWFTNKQYNPMPATAIPPYVGGAIINAPRASADVASYAMLQPQQKLAMQTNTQEPPLSPHQGIKRLIVRNATLTLQVNQLKESVDSITQLANASGGYVVRSRITEDSGPNGLDTADISIRVPSKGLHSALMQLQKLASRVLSEEVTGDDITKQYVDLESALTNLNTSKHQLEKIMTSAKSTQDVLAVYQQLSNTQGQIDGIEGQIAYYKESIDLSLITIQLQKTPALNAPQTHWQFRKTAENAYHLLTHQFEAITYGVITFFIYVLPLLLLAMIACYLVFWLGERLVSSIKSRH